MKTITMDYSEYEEIVAARNNALEEVKRYQRAVEAVLGRLKAKTLFEDADRIIDQQNRMKLHQAVINGGLK